MGGGGGGGRFAGTIGAGGAFSGGTLSATFGTGQVSSRNATGHTGLGAYRGNQIGIYNGHPVVFDYTGKTPNRGLQLLSGAFVPEKGIAGAVATGADRQGTLRLVVYGDSKAGKPSSWTVYEWSATGEKHGATGWPKYGWERVPTEKAALAKPGFQELLKEYYFTKK